MRVLRSPLLLIAILAAAAVFAISLRERTDLAEASKDGVAMDTFVSLSIYAPREEVGEGELSKCLDDSFAILAELDSQMSITDPSSALSALNASRAGESSILPKELYDAIESAREMAEITGGAYDPTIGGVTVLWRYGDDGFKVPERAALDRMLQCVGPEMISLVPPRKAALAKNGVKIDLGGIAKGFASSTILKMLRERGVTNALINLGGNVALIGGRPTGGPWMIGVQDPARERGVPICAVAAEDTSVITAGVYERVFEADGVTYTHIYDPKTGMPISGDLRSVTVVCDDPTAGDALSTAFMVLGLDASSELLRTLPDVEAIFIREAPDGTVEIAATNGLSGAIDMMTGAKIRYIEVH